MIDKSIANQNPHSRLIITQFEIENFKSYRGIHKITPLNPNQTAVVGPNGSGKSNLFDALQFVFGVGKTRLRLDGKEDMTSLIHSSNQASSLDQCQVTITFQLINQKQDGFTEQYGNSFSLTRRIDKSEKKKTHINKQQINNIETKLKDVKVLLRKYNIDLNTGRFIILQFEVKNIADMSSKCFKEQISEKPFQNYQTPGLLEYVDEVVGTKKLYKLIMDSQLKSITQEKAVTLSRNDFDLVLNDLSAMQTKFDKVKILIQNQKKQFKFSNELYQLKNFYNKNCINKLEIDLEEIAVRFNEMKNEKNIIDQKLKTQNECKKKSFENILKIENEMKNLNDNNMNTNNNISNLKKQLKKLDKELFQNKTDLNNLSEKMNEKINIDHLISKLKEEQLKLEKQKQECSEYEKQHTTLIEKNKEELEPISTQINSLKVKINSIDEMLINNSFDQVIYQNELKQLNEEIQLQEIKYDEINQCINKTREEIISNQNIILENDKEILKINSKLNESDKAVRIHNNKYQDLVNRLKSLEFEKKSIQNSKDKIKDQNVYQIILQKINEQFHSKTKIQGFLVDILFLKSEDVFPHINILLESQKDLIVIRDKEYASEIQAFVKNNAKNWFNNTSALKNMKMSMLALNTLDTLNFRETPKINLLQRVKDLVTVSDQIDPKYGDKIINKICSNLQISFDYNEAIRIYRNKPMNIFVNGIHLMSNGVQKPYKDYQLPKVGETNRYNVYNKDSTNTIIYLSQNQIEQRMNLINNETEKLNAELNYLESSTPVMNNNDDILNKLNSLHDTKNIINNNISRLKYEEKQFLNNQNHQSEIINDMKIKITQVNKYLSENDEKIKKNNELSDKKTELNIELKKCQLKYDSIVDNQLQIQIKIISDQIIDSLKLIDYLENDIKQNNNIQSNNSNKQSKIQNKIQEIENKIKETNESKLKFDEIILSNNTQIEKMDIEINKLKAEISAIEVEIKSFEKINSEFDLRLKDICSEKMNIDNQMKDQNDQIFKIDKNQRQLKDVYSKLLEAYPIIKNNLDQKPLTLDDIDRFLQNKNNELKNSENFKRIEQNILDFYHNEDYETEENENISSNIDNIQNIDDQNDKSSSQQNDKNESPNKSQIDNQLVSFNSLTDEYLKEFMDESIYNERILTLNSLINECKSQIEKSSEDYTILNKQSVNQFKAKEKMNEQLSQKAKQVTNDETLFIMKNTRDRIFNEAFSKINKYIKEIYSFLTSGGLAELEFESEGDPFEGGLRFQVRPPGKSWNKIGNLSGGEKTLASLSLIFALHELSPCPFQIMDEIDAALDIKNCTSVAKFVLRQCKTAQCIVVTLRSDMQEQASTMLGVYKLKDCTRNMIVDVERKNNQQDDENEIKNEQENRESRV